MRAFAACLSVVLGLGAFSVVACSSDATTTAAGGEAGEAPAVGGGGMTSSGGATGEAGASSCSFDSDACQTCVPMKCPDEVTACSGDDACLGALSALEVCVCGGTSLTTCEANFGKDGGDSAAPLVTCFNANCTSACQ
ncbi:MAG TPA: hypothetical protein VGF76_10900 [Polyangiaceae bacterium]